MLSGESSVRIQTPSNDLSEKVTNAKGWTKIPSSDACLKTLKVLPEDQRITENEVLVAKAGWYPSVNTTA